MSYFKKNRLLGPSPLPPRRVQAPARTYYPPPPEAPRAPPRERHLPAARQYQPMQRRNDYYEEEEPRVTSTKAYNKSNTFSFGLVLLAIVALGYFFGMKKRPMFNSARVY